MTEEMLASASFRASGTAEVWALARRLQDGGQWSNLRPANTRKLMSFLKSLFGLGGGKEEGKGLAATAKEAEHKGFIIRATPYKEGGQFQTAGTIVKEVGGEMKEYKFVRADRFSTLEEAADLSLSKGRQIIEEQGERMFGKG
jgi:hypothetical protein